MFTRRIVEASALLGLRVLDHIIVSDERHYSFLDAGELGSRGVAGKSRGRSRSRLAERAHDDQLFAVQVGVDVDVLHCLEALIRVIVDDGVGHDVAAETRGRW